MSFTLRFKPDHPDVKTARFEETLALRLLDIIYGRDSACSPDPVPLTNPGGSKRMIGSGNDTWLHREDDTTYTVTMRYKTPETAAMLVFAEQIIRQQYDNVLLPKDPILAPKESAQKTEAFDARLATSMKPVKTLRFRPLPKTIAP